MVLEAFAALSVANAAVQFVDFTLKVISKGNKYYKSPSGVLEEIAELRDTAAKIRRLTDLVTKSAAPRPEDNQEFQEQDLPDTSTRLKPAEQALEGAVKECKSIAAELIAALDKLELPGSHKRWNSFRQALKSCWGKKAIEQMIERLRLAREDLVLHLLVIMR